jgi:hypothetical protein
MIQDPTKLFEEVQNDVAAHIKSRSLFAGLKMPDGSAFDVLTEDQGDPEFLSEAQIAACGLSIVVQAPAAEFKNSGNFLIASRFVLSVSISELVLFNRDPNISGNTKIRLMKAALEVFKAVHRYAPLSIQRKLLATRLLKDRDTGPGAHSDELVASRILIFEATEVSVDLA